MDLKDALAPYPELWTAEPRDNEKILKFFDVTPMKGTGLQLRYERSPDFFRFLTMQGERYSVILGTAHYSHSQWKGRRATLQDRERLLAFLDQNARLRPFGFPAEMEFARRLVTWPKFSLENFYLAEDSHRRIGSVFCPWSPSPAKRITIENLPKRIAPLLFLSQILGFATPKLHQELPIHTLTWLETEHALALSEKQKAFTAALRAYVDDRTSHPFPACKTLIAFCDFDQEPLSPALWNFLKQETPMTLYEVLPEGGELLSRVKAPRPPGFEMALV